MADQNSNQNEIKNILLIPGAIVLVSIAVAIYMTATQIIPSVSELMNISTQYKDQRKQYDDITREIETLKQSNAQAMDISSNTEGLDKALFRPLEAGSDSESILAEEFNEILELMKSNTIKTRSVKYVYDPEDDGFIKNGSGKFSVCQLDMQMIASYTNFKNFIKDLYKHEHYLDISSIEIIPYKKNKSILLINLKLKLFAEKV